MTISHISHPANVKNILCSGVDSLVISSNVEWRDASLFSALDELKEKAKQNSVDFPGNLKHFKLGAYPELIYLIQKFPPARGKKGYAREE